MTEPHICSPVRPRCVCGGRLKIERVVHDRLAICTHRPSGRVARCGKTLYLVRAMLLGEAVLLVYEITRDQMIALSEVEMTALERFAYLGLTLPGVADDLRAA